MCAERIQRFLMAAIIALGTWLLYSGVSEGVYLLGFVVVMIIAWGIFDFCPSIFFIKKMGARPCYKKLKERDTEEA